MTPDRSGPARPGSARRLLRVGVAFCSALVLMGVGLGWWQTRGVSQADVIDPAAAGLTSDQNILLVGLDTRTDAHGNPLPASLLAALHAGASDDGGDNTDTIILVHVPAGSGRATAISIPRDAYVPIADGYGTHKINSAYTYGSNAARAALQKRGVAEPALTVAADAAGARTAIATVSALTGVPVTHYAAVNLAAFDAVSQAVGGVPVCLNAPVNDPFSGAHFPAGPQSISGAAALAFVRQRHGLPAGDLDRVRRQQAFLAAMSRQVLSSGTLTDPSRLGALIGAVQQNVTLDQGWNLLPFAEQLAGLHADAISFQTVPVVRADLDTPDDGQAVQVSTAQVRAFVTSVFTPPAGDDAAGGRPAGPAAALPALDPAATTVDVVNGNGGSGMAASTLAALTQAGYQAGQTRTTSTTRTTTIRYPTNGRPAAAAVAAAFTTPPPLVADPALLPGRVQVVLGRAGADLVARSSPSTTAPAQPVSAPLTANTTPCIN